MSAKSLVSFTAAIATGIMAAFPGTAAAGTRQIPAASCLPDPAAAGDFEFIRGLASHAPSERVVHCPIVNDDQLVVSAHPWYKPDIKDVWIDAWDGNNNLGADVKARVCHYSPWANVASCSPWTSITGGGFIGSVNFDFTRGTAFMNELVGDSGKTWWYADVEVQLPAPGVWGLSSLQGIAVVI